MSLIEFDRRGTEQIAAFLDDLPDPADMTLQQLEDAETEVRLALEKLNALEPENEESEAYDAWADLHEEAEDILDEILDAMED